MIGDDWEQTTPWAWSLDTMIADHVPDVSIENKPDGDADYPPTPEGERIVVGAWWWDTHSVEERRSALLDAAGRA